MAEENINGREDVKTEYMNEFKRFWSKALQQMGGYKIKIPPLDEQDETTQRLNTIAVKFNDLSETYIGGEANIFGTRILQDYVAPFAIKLLMELTKEAAEICQGDDGKNYWEDYFNKYTFS